MIKKPSLVSSLSMSFKKAIVSQDHEEVKTEHRANLKMLMDDYMSRVGTGEVDGIRNAEDLIEVMKMDLLLMGEATERTETNSTLDEAKVVKVSQVIDENDPNVQALMNDILMALNGANDDADDSPIKRTQQLEEMTDDDEHIDKIIKEMEDDNE